MNKKYIDLDKIDQKIKELEKQSEEVISNLNMDGDTNKEKADMAFAKIRIEVIQRELIILNKIKEVLAD